MSPDQQVYPRRISIVGCQSGATVKKAKVIIEERRDPDVQTEPPGS
jgi:hypothetical protein